VVPAAVQLDDEPGFGIREVHPAYPGIASSHIDLPPWLGKTESAHEGEEAGFELAGRRFVAVAPRVEEPAHDADALPSRLGQLDEHRSEGADRGRPCRKAVVDGPLGTGRVEDTGEVDQCPGDPGGPDSIHDGQVVVRQDPPAMHPVIRVPVAAWAGRDRLDRARPIESGNTQQRRCGTVGCAGDRPADEHQTVESLLPAPSGPGQSVQAGPDEIPPA